MAGSALVTGGQAGHEMAGLSLGRTLTTGLITERMLGGEEEARQVRAVVWGRVAVWGEEVGSEVNP